MPVKLIYDEHSFDKAEVVGANPTAGTTLIPQDDLARSHQKLPRAVWVGYLMADIERGVRLLVKNFMDS
jgi:hypothetical protein